MSLTLRDLKGNLRKSSVYLSVEEIHQGREDYLMDSEIRTEYFVIVDLISTHSYIITYL